MDGRRTKLREGVQEIGPVPIALEPLFSRGGGLRQTTTVPYCRLGGLVVLVRVLRRGEEAHGCPRASPSSQMTQCGGGTESRCAASRRAVPGAARRLRRCFQSVGEGPRAPRVCKLAAPSTPLPKLNRECGCRRFTFWTHHPKLARPGFVCREGSSRRLSAPGATGRQTSLSPDARCKKKMPSPGQRQIRPCRIRSAAAPPATAARQCPLRQPARGAGRRGSRAPPGRTGLPRLHLQLRGRRRFGCSPCISSASNASKCAGGAAS